MWAEPVFRRPIVLLGAGQLSHMALELWPEEIQKPTVILAEEGPAAIKGIPVQNPSQHNPDSDNTYVLSYFKDSATNVKRLFAEHLNQDIVTVYDILTHFNPDMFSNGWQGTPDEYEHAIETIACFPDIRSRHVYRCAAEWRYRRVLVDDYPLIPATEKYKVQRPPGECLTHFDFILDAGAYDLSLASTLAAEGISWNSYVAIEPDPSRSRVLTSALKELSIEGRSSVCVDIRALWNATGSVPFYANGLMSARVARQETNDTNSVPAITLEDLVAQLEIPEGASMLMKLHIEGAEWPVLESSRCLLERIGQTQIFVNLSHDEDSLLRIPKLLASLGYLLELNSYSLFGEGLTLSATKPRSGDCD